MMAMNENYLAIHDDSALCTPAERVKRRARAVAWYVSATVVTCQMMWFGLAMVNAGRWLFAAHCGAMAGLMVVAIVRKLLAK